jgi:hypothetical protein
MAKDGQGAIEETKSGVADREVVADRGKKKKGRTTRGNEEGGAAFGSKEEVEIPDGEEGPEKPKSKDGKGEGIRRNGIPERGE